MAQITRPLIALLSLVGLWFVAMVLEALRLPVWVMVMNGGLLLVNLVVLVSLVHRVTCETDRRQGDGGLPPPRSDVPDSGGGSESDWWPELERELAQYLAEQEVDQPRRQRVPVGRTQLTDSTRSLRTPVGVGTSITSPTPRPMSALATGEAAESAPSEGRASCGDTILKVC